MRCQKNFMIIKIGLLIFVLLIKSKNDKSYVHVITVKFSVFCKISDSFLKNLKEVKNWRLKTTKRILYLYYLFRNRVVFGLRKCVDKTVNASVNQYFFSTVLAT